ncbi:monodehydroascorbate reductase [Striga asiatica]|uniref:monodehydroascorbate reductase (NADH) n=1 Tax=Striga asiatica TaxID=4170 RepID=A0A5A7QBD2_STRAF|nr:monodehydroascorbate reductase [Striga asiatica]
MGRAFVYVIIGGGVAAGYAAHEFVKRGVSHGELCIISEEPVAPYERPALSKGYLLPEGIYSLSITEQLFQSPSRVPMRKDCLQNGTRKMVSFSNVAIKEAVVTGIELILSTRVKSADVRRKTLLTATGETISYKYLIVATGARNAIFDAGPRRYVFCSFSFIVLEVALRLEEFGVNGLDAANVCYLRDLADADRLVNVMQSCSGGNAVVIGGGYIGMECAASLVINKLNVTMVFPEAQCMARLFTPKIASYYEEFYQSKGVKFVKGTVLTSFDFSSDGKVTAVNLRDGSKLPADMVVVGIGIRPNTSLFEGQLTMEKGGIKVNGKMQSSNPSVYAIGDVASFPVLTVGGETRRLEHVDSARRSARHVVASVTDGPEISPDFDYLPFFYSRVFTLSWQFYGDNAGEAVHFGDFFAGPTLGAYWVNKGRVVGSFLEGGTKEQYEAVARVARVRPRVEDVGELQRRGLDGDLDYMGRTIGDGLMFCWEKLWVNVKSGG